MVDSMKSGPKPSAPGERLSGKYYIDEDSGCWIWTSGRNAAGYGRINSFKKKLMAHRVSYEHHVGPIPEGLQIDHLCKNTSCINPAHLEPVSGRENVVRSNHPKAIMYRENRCMNGHDLAVHAYHVPGKTSRRCIICRDEYRRQYETAKRMFPTGA